MKEIPRSLQESAAGYTLALKIFRKRQDRDKSTVRCAGFAIAHGLGFRINKFAIDHRSHHQHVIAGRMFIHYLALEPSQSLKQQGWANAIVRPIHQSQFVGSGWPAGNGWPDLTDPSSAR